MKTRLISAGLGLVLALSAVPAAAQQDGVMTVDVIDRDRLVGELIVITGDDAKSVNLAIEFAVGSAALAESSHAQLDELGHALGAPELADLKVGIYGHTDASGPADYNQALSERRADSVRAYLVENFGLNSDRLDVRGYGESRLLDRDNPSAAANRRVEIVTSRADLLEEDAQAGDNAEPKPAPAGGGVIGAGSSAGEGVVEDVPKASGSMTLN